MASHDTQLRTAIQHAVDRGLSREAIYTTFLAKGYTVAAIQEALATIVAQETHDTVHRRAVHVVVAAGVAMIGAGIFSFVAANWASLSSAVKVIVLLGTMAAAYGSGWFLRERTTMRLTGSALIVAGSIIYGASIFLVGQIFNIGVQWWDGLIMWIIGMLVMAFATGMTALFVLTLFLGYLTVALLPFSTITHAITGDVPWQEPFLFTTTVWFAVATVLTFAAGYAIRKKIDPATLRQLP